MVIKSRIFHELISLRPITHTCSRPGIVRMFNLVWRYWNDVISVSLFNVLTKFFTNLSFICRGESSIYYPNQPVNLLLHCIHKKLWTLCLAILFPSTVEHQLGNPKDTKIIETLYNLLEFQLVSVSFLSQQ